MGVSWFESIEPQSDFFELFQEFRGFVEFWNSCTDGDTSDGSARFSGLLDQSGFSYMEIPEIGVQIESVEDDLLAGIQCGGQLVYAELEHLFCDLTPSSEF